MDVLHTILKTWWIRGASFQITTRRDGLESYLGPLGTGVVTSILAPRPTYIGSESYERATIMPPLKKLLIEAVFMLFIIIYTILYPCRKHSMYIPDPLNSAACLS